MNRFSSSLFGLVTVGLLMLSSCATSTPARPPEVTTGTALLTTASVGTPVTPGEFTAYKHPSGVFTISVPRTWGLQEPASPSGVIRTFFRAPNSDIVLGITVLAASATTTVQEGAKMLQSLVENGFSDAEEFAVQGEPIAQDDGSQRITFTFSHSEAGRKTSYIGNAFAQLNTTRLSVLFVVKTAPTQGQEDPRDVVISTVLNSYRIYPEVPLP